MDAKLDLCEKLAEIKEIDYGCKIYDGKGNVKVKTTIGACIDNLRDKKHNEIPKLLSLDILSKHKFILTDGEKKEIKKIMNDKQTLPRKALNSYLKNYKHRTEKTEDFKKFMNFLEVEL